jgi:hypothetical protein
MTAKADPVWHRTVTMTRYDGVVEGPGWYHWCYDKLGYVESHAGPFTTEAEARAAHAAIEPKEKP